MPSCSCSCSCRCSAFRVRQRATVTRPLLALLLVVALAGGCGSNRFRGPVFLGVLGAAAAAAGGSLMAVGSREGESIFERAGAISLAAGFGLILTAGWWMNLQNKCEVDADCDEKETCSSYVTPAGQIQQCVPR